MREAIRRSLLCAALWPALAGATEPPPPVELPLTLERVWFRTVRGRAWVRLGNAAGDLTVGSDALSFSTGKKTVEVPIDRVRQLSYGTIRGDVNTEWALLGIGDRRTDSIVAVRDGRRMGYGQRTAEIHEQLRSALRALGAAHYRVPQGFQAFDTFDKQFSLAFPAGWESHVSHVVVVGDRAPWGTVVFSSEPIRDGSAVPPTVDEPAVARALAGERPAFFVERLPAENGMRCSGFTAKGAQRLLALAATGELSPGGGGVAGTPAVAPEQVDRCNGLRLLGAASAAPAQIELHAVAAHDTLYVFGARSLPQHSTQTRDVLESVLRTVMFSVSE